MVDLLRNAKISETSSAGSQLTLSSDDSLKLSGCDAETVSHRPSESTDHTSGDFVVEPAAVVSDVAPAAVEHSEESVTEGSAGKGVNFFKQFSNHTFSIRQLS
jgi:hypothetical protein